MIFVDPLFQACIGEVVRASVDLFSPDSTSGDQAGYVQRISSHQSETSQWRGLPVIYDEGRLFNCQDGTYSDYSD